MEQFAIGIAWPKREPSPKDRVSFFLLLRLYSDLLLVVLYSLSGIKVLSARFLVSLWFHACCFQNKIAQPSIRAGLPKSAAVPQLIR